MQVLVFWLGKTRLPGVTDLTTEYTRRLGRFCDIQAEGIRASGRKPKGIAPGEAALLARTEGCYRVALDPAGQRWSSGDLAGWLRQCRDEGRRAVSFCVGDAEGFSDRFRQQADLLLSLSPMTLPHELARVVLLEQIYRAFTMLAGHPYPR